MTVFYSDCLGDSVACRPFLLLIHLAFQFEYDFVAQIAHIVFQKTCCLVFTVE